jgi:hypothetical protein
MNYQRLGRAKLPVTVVALTQFLRAGTLALIATVGAATDAATVWTGPTISFTRPANSDWTLSANQDRLTANVWITRATIQGLFNIKAENGYTVNLSPTDTEWAYGDLVNYASLTYAPWQIWNATNPPAMVGQSAVLHLLSDDIYLSVQFTAWGQGLGGGLFAYERSTPAVVPATAPVISQPMVTNNQFVFSYSADLGFSYVAQNSSNLLDWRSVATNVAASNPVLFTNSILPNGPWFYRVGRLSPP